VFYPFEHVGVCSEKLHHFITGAQSHFLLTQFHELIIINSTTHIPVNLGEFSNFAPGPSRVIEKESSDPLNPLQFILVKQIRNTLRNTGSSIPLRPTKGNGIGYS